MHQKQKALNSNQINQFLKSIKSFFHMTKQEVREYLQNQPIKKAYFRDLILEQNQRYNKGYLIVQGSVQLSKQVQSSSLVLAELGNFQVINMEYFLYHKSQYRVTVHSSELQYLTLSSDILKVCFMNNQNLIQQKQERHLKQISSKKQQHKKIIQGKAKDNIVKQLSLPDISLRSKKPQKYGKNKLTTERPISPFFSYESQSLKKSISIKLHQNQDRMKSSANEDKQKDRQQYRRNEAIFKDQLKSIIKRKLLYQRKQLGVLQAYRQDVERYIKQEEHITESQNLDSYFKI